MELIKTELDGVVLLVPRVFSDSRGYFSESFNKKTLAQLGIDFDGVQDNHSLTVSKGTIRGLHYQLDPMAQTKIVRVASGEIFDVAVDIRKNSPQFGKWTSRILSAENKHQLLVPKGFAHGFCSLIDNVEVVYKVDQYYSPEHDRGVIWNDPDIHVKWPVEEPLLSDKDKILPRLNSIS